MIQKLLSFSLGGINFQGILGIIAAVTLAGFLVAEKVDHRKTSNELTSVTQLYNAEKAAHTQTEVNYRRAAEKARQDNLAHVAKVKAAYDANTKRSTQEYEARIATARARADSLRRQANPAAANPGAAGTARPSGVPGAPAGSDEAPSDRRLSLDERLIATEQAIQLDELITWVERQSKVEVNR